LCRLATAAVRMLAEFGVLALVKLIDTNLPSLRLSRTRVPMTRGWMVKLVGP
jgi:hypothetical protein